MRGILSKKATGGRACLTCRLAACAAILAAPAVALPAADGAFGGRPAPRAQAVASLSAASQLPIPCLTPILQAVQREGYRTVPSARRALAALLAETALAAERRLALPDGTVFRYSADPQSPDGVDATDEDGDGTPEAVEAAARGLAEARDLLVEGLDLPAPGAVEVLLADVGDGVDGYVLTRRRSDRRLLIVLDTAPRGGAREIRRAAIHQYAHVVGAAVGPAGLPAGWSEALATWAELRLGGADEDPELAALLSRRLAGLHAGLLAEDLDLAAGNAAWLAFLEAAYGAASVRATIEELAAGGPAAAALDRGARRGGGASLESAFRDFHLWSVLTGGRDDGRHFPFASRLAPPAFASVFEGLPCLAVQPEPALEPLGAVQALVVSEEERGGLTLRFEGETPGTWDADLLLVMDSGQLRRVPVEIGPDGRGRLTVPLDGLAEALLLVRNLDESGGPRRYSWSADRAAGYPFEIASLDASPLENGEGVLLRWETASESGLVGFNVRRILEGGSEERRINPVWIPAFGNLSSPAFYQFVDATAEPGFSYRYRIEGVTSEGLSSFSDPVVVEAKAPSSSAPLP